jgi:hypothetical protein
VKNFFQKAADDLGYGKARPSAQFEPVKRSDGSLDRGRPAPQERIITRQEINEHHQKIIRGGYRSADPAEQKRLDEARRVMDQKICDASREGRIR